MINFSIPAFGTKLMKGFNPCGLKPFYLLEFYHTINFKAFYF